MLFKTILFLYFICNTNLLYDDIDNNNSYSKNNNNNINVFVNAQTNNNNDNNNNNEISYNCTAINAALNESLNDVGICIINTQTNPQIVCNPNPSPDNDNGNDEIQIQYTPNLCTCEACKADFDYLFDLYRNLTNSPRVMKQCSLDAVTLAYITAITKSFPCLYMHDGLDCEVSIHVCKYMYMYM